MGKVMLSGQPELNTDEEKLVVILGDYGVSEVLKSVMNKNSINDLRVFDNSDITDINLNNVDFNKVITATVIGYERAVKRVSTSVRSDLSQIAKAYEEFQERRLLIGNADDDETPTHLLQRSELDGIIEAYETVLNTSNDKLDEVVSKVMFNVGQRVAESRKEFYTSTNEQYSRDLEDYGVDFDTTDTVEQIIHYETMSLTLSSLMNERSLNV